MHSGLSVPITSAASHVKQWTATCLRHHTSGDVYSPTGGNMTEVLRTWSEKGCTGFTLPNAGNFEWQRWHTAVCMVISPHTWQNGASLHVWTSWRIRNRRRANWWHRASQTNWQLHWSSAWFPVFNDQAFVTWPALWDPLFDCLGEFVTPTKLTKHASNFSTFTLYRSLLT